LGIFEERRPRQEQEDTMSSDMGSFPDPKITLFITSVVFFFLLLLLP